MKHHDGWERALGLNTVLVMMQWGDLIWGHGDKETVLDLELML